MTAHAATVLTVEDNPIVRADLRLILEDAGFVVCPDAQDGLEAIEREAQYRPDLVLIDLNLPNLDGVEATRRILHRRDVPIVALTGHGRELADQAVEAGAVAQIRKPFDAGHLVRTIEGVLEQAVERRRDADASEHRSTLVMIERMVHDGHTEREITDAVRRATAPEPMAPVVGR